VLAALAEIEAGSDEQMRDDDSIDPPNVSANTGRGRKAPSFEGLRADAGDAAPVAQVPMRATEPAKKTQGFRAVDVVIALIALVVIGLSILGLTWLFRSN
jgi:hypothetical protein